MPNPSDRVSDLFSGGGELGAMMRAFDWAQTPLGPPEGWPHSLRTCLRIILTSRQPMFVWWGDQLINLYNDAYRAILGGKHPTALGQPAATVWREIWAQVGPRVNSAMRLNEGTYDEALLLLMERHGYPEETYYTFSYSPVPNDQGAPGGIICANTDDTQRIIVERQLSLLGDLATRTAGARSVEDASARCAQALGTNPHDVPFALLYLASEDGHTAARVGQVGFSGDTAAAPAVVSLVGESVWPLGEVLRTLQPQVVALAQGLPMGAWTVAPTQALLLPLFQPGQPGRPGVLVVGLSPYRLLGDSYRGFLELVAGQVRASLAQAQAREEEQRRADALAEIDRAKTVFFSNVSHEFRTPLTLMLGPTEDALASPERSLRGEDLETVHRNELRLLRLVNQLLDFARIEAGRVQAAYAPTDLAALTADLASAFRSAIERGGLRFEVDCPPLDAPVFVDRAMWEKVVLNLLSNAFKFTFEGGIRVSLRASDGEATLQVSDTGGGIPASELGRLFDRFHRVESTRSRTHEGSGIGLALVHDLVKLHGGRVEVASEPGRGTTFTVAIPTGSAHLPAEALVGPEGGDGPQAATQAFIDEALGWLPAAAAPAAAPVASGAPRPRLLIADDNADMRGYIGRLLSPHWAVDAVADGAEALASARRDPPALVLADVMMPGLDGFTLVRELRSDPRTATIPIILLSARAGEEATAEGLRSGADDYIVKPFSASVLLVRVEAALATARVRAATTAAAERERQNLYAMFMAGPAAVAVLRGPDFVVDMANPIILGFWGKGPEAQGRPLLEAVPELRDQPFLGLLREVVRTGKPYRAQEARALLDRQGDGTRQEAFFDFTYEPIRGGDGRAEGVLVFAVEVTQQILVQRALEVALQQAETANRAKDEFLAILGHELRNPLAPITTALHLMRLRSAEAHQRERVVIERQVEHLTRLVDDLLDVSRITRGKVELKRRRVELSKVVARAIELSSPLLERQRHQLALDVAADGLAVDVDETRLVQVVSNLVANAAKYTPPGGHVTVAARRDGGEVVLVVRDDGIGIAPEVLPQVFELFVQDQQALDRAQGGLGLGLAIVRSLVKLHGGSVVGRSEGKGQGSEFEVRLPAAERAEAALVTAASPSAGREKQGLRILVVDDNEDAAVLLAEALGAQGYTLRVAHDGPAALQIAAGFAPELGFLDVGLPLMDGYELARRLRELPGLAKVRLVAVTGYGQESDRQQAKQAGFDAHLVKPVSVEAVLALVHEYEASRSE